MCCDLNVLGVTHFADERLAMLVLIEKNLYIRWNSCTNLIDSVYNNGYKRPVHSVDSVCRIVDTLGGLRV